MVSNNLSFLPDNNSGSDAEAKLDLKAIRESKGLTLQDIFMMTRISVVNLEAIENNDLHLLPAPVYAKTFIKTYAKALGVDSKDILERYARHMRSLNTPEPEKPPEKPARKMRIPITALAASIAVLMVCSLVLLSLALRDNTSEIDVSAPARPVQTAKAPADAAPTEGASAQAPLPAAGGQAPVQSGAAPAVARKTAVPPAALPQKPPAQTVAAGASPSPAAVSDGTKPAPQGAYRLSITARELTWLQIVSDQNPPDEVMLRPGEKLDRSASEQFQVLVGNAGGIDAEFQGSPLGTLGKSGEVVRLKLP